LLEVHENLISKRITESAARELDSIALEYGVDIIVDDVLRGTQAFGERDTIARWFTRPFVVEGFSKRLGEEHAGDLSYALSPKDISLPIEADKEEGHLHLVTQAIEEGNEYSPQFTYLPRNPLYSYFTISPSFQTYKRELKYLFTN